MMENVNFEIGKILNLYLNTNFKEWIVYNPMENVGMYRSCSPGWHRGVIFIVFKLLGFFLGARWLTLGLASAEGGRAKVPGKTINTEPETGKRSFERLITAS